jgi:hypothetical protein
MSDLPTVELFVHGITALCLLTFFATSIAYGLHRGLKRHRRAHRAQRHQARLLDLAAARAIRRRPVHRGGLGVIVYADARDVEAARVPRLVEHLRAIHASSERLLDAAEIAEYDPAFCARLQRHHQHLAGLLEQVAPERRIAR